MFKHGLLKSQYLIYNASPVSCMKYKLDLAKYNILLKDPFGTTVLPITNNLKDTVQKNIPFVLIIQQMYFIYNIIIAIFVAIRNFI